MSDTSKTKVQNWIKGPIVDLCFFSYGWLAILGAYFFIDQSDFKMTGRALLLNFVLLISVFHRHLTFPLVYGDPEQFRLRKKSYLAMPVFFFAITLSSLFYIKAPSFLSQEIPLPVHVSSNDALIFRVVDHEKNQQFTVPFKGTELTVGELVATLQGKLHGLIQVSEEEGRLHFTLPSTDPNARFSFSPAPRSSNFMGRLGLPASASGFFQASRPYLMALVIFSLLWNFYHTLMQKQGVLRVYSRKASYGKSWLDKAMIWTWFVFLFFQLGSMPSTVQRVSQLSLAGGYLRQGLDPLQKIFPYLAALAFVVAMVVTILYLKEEISNRKSFHWPKNLFMLSVLLLYSLFFYDFLVAYVAFGFSHAIEYLGFVNIFGRRKFLPRPVTSSLMAAFIHRQTLSMAIYLIAMMVIFIPWHYLSSSTLEWYILASSFLHFLYDGWIWKVRNPAVGKPLGIHYEVPAQVQPA